MILSEIKPKFRAATYAASIQQTALTLSLATVNLTSYAKC